MADAPGTFCIYWIITDIYYDIAVFAKHTNITKSSLNNADYIPKIKRKRNGLLIHQKDAEFSTSLKKH